MANKCTDKMVVKEIIICGENGPEIYRPTKEEIDGADYVKIAGNSRRFAKIDETENERAKD